MAFFAITVLFISPESPIGNPNGAILVICLFALHFNRLEQIPVVGLGHQKYLIAVVGTGIGVGCIAAVQEKYNGGLRCLASSFSAEGLARLGRMIV